MGLVFLSDKRLGGDPERQEPGEASSALKDWAWPWEETQKGECQMTQALPLLDYWEVDPNWG